MFPPKKYYKFIPFSSKSSRERVHTFIDLDRMKCCGVKSSELDCYHNQSNLNPLRSNNLNDLKLVLRGLNPNINSMAQKNISMLLGMKENYKY